jgi:hypothetical protein
MTQKEKAQELVDKYVDYVAMADRYSYTLYSDLIVLAKKCALIAVDEIVESLDLLPLASTKEYYELKKYWQEVKQEIEKL